ncbi:hypothetical protein D3C78_1960450 [compost metagenome]
MLPAASDPDIELATYKAKITSWLTVFFIEFRMTSAAYVMEITAMNEIGIMLAAE